MANYIELMDRVYDAYTTEHIRRYTKTVREDDKISVRGKVRIIIKSIDGLSKKVRIRFTHLKL